MIQAAGYPAERHYITTDDCYVLEVHRIPYGKLDSQKEPRLGNPVVLLQHGLTGSSDNWVLSWSKPTESLGRLKINVRIIIYSEVLKIV